MSYCGIYSITNTVTGHVYIGQTNKPFIKRWKEHRGKLLRGTHQNKQLQADWAELGEKSFLFRVLEIVDIYAENGCLRTAEKRHIDAATAPLYNIFKPTALWDVVQYVPPPRH